MLVHIPVTVFKRIFVGDSELHVSLLRDRLIGTIWLVKYW